MKVKESEKNLKGLKELRYFLSEKDIVTGYYEDCAHREFKSRVNFFPCPWDKRVQEEGESDVTCGCYYKCGKHNEKILYNKVIYLRSIDKLISLLENNPNWGKESKEKEGILNDIDKKHLYNWDKAYQLKKDIKLKERNALREINEVYLKGGCPVELFSDLKKLRTKGAIAPDMDIFWEFHDDKFIYIDWYEGMEEKHESNNKNASLIMEFNPAKPHEGLHLMLGNGCMAGVKTIWNKRTEKLLTDFYFKWKQYRQLNPEKYIKYR